MSIASPDPDVTDAARAQAIARSLDLFWPDPPEDAWLVVSWRKAPGDFPSKWFRCHDRDDALAFLTTTSTRCDTYIGMGLRHPACVPQKRGTSADVCAIGGLWVEFDHNAGVHNTKHLPTPFQLGRFLQAQPMDFSLIIDSTGGLHAHLLFKELWVLKTEADREAAHLLVRRLQRSLQIAASAQGWHIDTTADLARVLRPAGTCNFKTGTPQLVTIVEDNALRYDPSDLANELWLAEIDDTYTPTSGSGEFADAHLERMVKACAWLKHCHDDAQVLPEPEWYAMLGLVGRCVDGEQHAHEWSRPYPRYDKDETTKKLQHALNDAGPRTCTTIRYDLDGDAYCRDCPHWGTVTSPITIAMDDRVRAVGGSASALAAKPVIKITPDIVGVTTEAEQAILALPDGPHLYQRVHQLVMIMRGVKPPQWLRRAPDMPVIAEAGAAYVRGLFAQSATWLRFDKRSHKWEHALPPEWVAKRLFEAPAWDFPPLEGILFTPTLRPDGSVLHAPGYDASTGLSLDYNGIVFPPIPAHPTRAEALKALALLREILQDFPFAEPWHRSAVYAAILTLLIRHAIEGNVPLFAARSTTRGSGKSLLIDVISLIGTGRMAPRMAQTLDEEEETKRLMTLALAGTPTVHIDNDIHPLGSAPLDMVLTSSSILARILGTNTQREAPFNAVVFASGNNMQFKGDTARRVIPIDLAPQMERPEERSGFLHDPLPQWVSEHRPALVIAGLTILRAYFAANTPAQALTPYGSYEAWSHLIRHSLVWLGEPDPCEGRSGLETQSDPHYERIATLLTCWRTCYPDDTYRPLRTVTQDAIHLGSAQHKLPANHWDELREALGAFDDRYDGRGVRSVPVGHALRAIKGRIINNMRFLSIPNKHTKVLEWRAEELS